MRIEEKTICNIIKLNTLAEILNTFGYMCKNAAYVEYGSVVVCCMILVMLSGDENKWIRCDIAVYVCAGVTRVRTECSAHCSCALENNSFSHMRNTYIRTVVWKIVEHLMRFFFFTFLFECDRRRHTKYPNSFSIRN